MTARLCCVAGAGFILSVTPGVMFGQSSPRERISIDENWRFTKGDPTNSDVSLLYDERKSQALRRFAQEADGNSAVNQSATNQTTNAAAVIKQWILPTGNDFIQDVSRKYTRP